MTITTRICRSTLCKGALQAVPEVPEQRPHPQLFLPIHLANDLPHLTAAFVGRVVKVAVRTKLEVNCTGSRPELRHHSTHHIECEDGPAGQIGKQVIVVECRRPVGAGRHERTAGDGATAGLVLVGMDRLDKTGRLRAIRRAANDARSLSNVLAIVSSRRTRIDLLPGVTPNIIDKEALSLARIVRIEGNAERIAETRCVDLLADERAATRP